MTKRASHATIEIKKKRCRKSKCVESHATSTQYGRVNIK